MKYLCKKCCEKMGVYFNGIAENRVGRKSCHVCGNNKDWTLSTYTSKPNEENLRLRVD